MGPLSGVKVIELAALGPVPFAGMVLSDLGAGVVRIDRVDQVGRRSRSARHLVIDRGRRSIAIDLKSTEGLELLLSMVEDADVLMEGYRPGVAERLGFGPDTCQERNPRLTYGRATGWGQEGPLSATAGHDIDYIALAGALDPIGRAGGPPSIPLNFVGDNGGGGMFLALGIVCSLFESTRSGIGQVVDAAMVDGAALLTTVFHGLISSGDWQAARGTNLLDSGAPFYDVYETADGKFMAVGAIEPQFYAELLNILEIQDVEVTEQMERTSWPITKERLAAVFKSHNRDYWTRKFETSDACVAPVLGMSEASGHPHNQLRGTFVEVEGVTQPAPAPRFGRTPGSITRSPALPGTHTDEILSELGKTSASITKLRARGVVA